MFRLKSVFIKFVAAFLLINAISFIILTTTITIILNSYGTGVKTETLENAANSTAVYIQRDFTDQYKSFSDYLYGESVDLKRVLELLAVNDNSMIIFIVNEEGKVIHFGGSNRVSIATEANSDGSGRYFIPASMLNSLSAGRNFTETDDMSSFFKGDHVYYAMPLSLNGNYTGAVFAASNNTDMDALVNTMNRTVIMSTLWIMLASLVAIYFISERLISPIKDMSRAAKSFASGQFDARVPIIGNDEVAELAMAFNNMATSLQTQEDLRRTFLANVSHDLRTPMTTISGFIDGILDGAIAPEQQNYYLGVVASEVRRLSRLVSQLLDISRMEAGERKFVFTRFDICEMAREIIIANIQRLEDKHLDVQFESDEDSMFVSADIDAIHQILYNICDNAIKFSNDGGAYRIQITENEKKIYVSVYNEGIGIAEEDLPYVFERFYKGDKSRGMDKTGVGLGMYITRTIIEAHGQKIKVESEQGKWCKFTFTLALARVDKNDKRSKQEEV